ncbi:MAG: transglutaminase family protein [Candidatus Hodarchaeota archaeon]
MHWKNNILFNTSCKITEGSVDKLVLHIKYPCSDLRQKIKLFNSSPEPNIRKFISRGSYERYTYEFGTLSEEIEIITTFNAKIVPGNYRISKSPFPVILDNEFLNYYLQPTPLVESNNFEIHELAENLTILSKFLTETVSRIVRYFKTYIKTDTEYLNIRQSAIDTFRIKKGSCEDINHLFNAICRAVNIPVRLVLGFSKMQENWGRHVWSEVYDPQFGWYPIDLLTEPPQVGYVDTSHLKILTALDSSEAEIEVDYEHPISTSPIITVNHSLFIDQTVIPVHIEINQKKENKTEKL